MHRESPSPFPAFAVIFGAEGGRDRQGFFPALIALHVIICRSAQGRFLPVMSL